MSEPVDPVVTAEATSHLIQLADQLRDRGLHARLLSRPQQVPRLRVINPEAASLTETISAAPVDAVWWFWWSWAEQITPVGKLDAAAERVHYVLTPAGCSS